LEVNFVGVAHRASDGKHYEKRIDTKGHESEPICIEDEIPFDIPESWEWVRLGSVATFSGGGTPDKGNPRFWNGSIPWASMKDIHGERLEKTIDTITEDGLASKPSITLCNPGELIVSTRLVPGKTIVSNIHCAINQDLKVIHSSLPVPYLSLWFKSQLRHFKRLGLGTTVPGIKLLDLESALMPLPPLKEQFRIAKKYESLKTYIGDYDTLETAREKLDAELPERLRKSILQLAVEGKLVAQDSDDEPASVLLERIREQRRQLIAEGKMKAPKGGESVIYRASDGGYYEKRIDTKGRESEPVCIDDEIPFEIPDSWEWVRLTSICDHIVDGDHNPPPNAGKGVPLLSAANVHDGKLHIEEAVRWITQDDYQKASKRLSIKLGNVLMTIVGTIGRTAVVNYVGDFALQRSVAVISQMGLNPYFLSYVLESYSSYLVSISTGTAQKGVYLGTISSLLIPIPTLEEQARIVKRLAAVQKLTNQ
jgi:type I restriction enzyme S subunit